ncbi:hypothetical protein BDZ45DRAFT_711174 [Acephala macrosclerotiorum]|nr:hypothetical protein BDZ45DRAFT_711174 [Acephala macrosclerotiorum]
MRPSPILLSSTLKSLRRPTAIQVFSGKRMPTQGIPSETAQLQKQANMSTSASASGKEHELGVESQVNSAAGVQLSGQQTLLVGSVLDLFAGKPTLKKLQLWADDATFADPLTKAEGRKQYEAQWYGLKAAFSSIEQLHSQVTSAGNPITMDLKTRYVVKGIGKEQTINSVIKIFTDESGERIKQVEDRWDGEIPDGAIAKVSLLNALNPFWWVSLWMELAYKVFCWVAWTRWWVVFRNLNSMVVPAFVSVPKSEEEEAKKST